MSAQQNGNFSLNQFLTLDEVSNFFSLPIAEAANTLGVCSSVLKKICRDNGIVRWPYRQFLSGKTVEEIKKDAVRERNKELVELSQADREKNDAPASSVLSSNFGSQLQNKMVGTMQDTSKARGVAPPAHILQQQGRPQIMLNSSLAKGIPTYFDEFKNGFPTDGLSTSSIRWWGGSSPDETEIFGDEAAIDQGDKQKSPKLAGNEANCSTMEDEKPGQGMEENDIGPQGTALLSSVRKRAAEDGREALKLGDHRGYGAYKLRRREKLLLLKIFTSSLPRQ